MRPSTAHTKPTTPCIMPRAELCVRCRIRSYCIVTWPCSYVTVCDYEGECDTNIHNDSCGYALWMHPVVMQLCTGACRRIGVGCSVGNFVQRCRNRITLCLCQRLVREKFKCQGRGKQWGTCVRCNIKQEFGSCGLGSMLHSLRLQTVSSFEQISTTITEAAVKLQAIQWRYASHHRHIACLVRCFSG